MLLKMSVLKAMAHTFPHNQLSMVIHVICTHVAEDTGICSLPDRAAKVNICNGKGCRHVCHCDRVMLYHLLSCHVISHLVIIQPG